MAHQALCSCGKIMASKINLSVYIIVILEASGETSISFVDMIQLYSENPPIDDRNALGDPISF